MGVTALSKRLVREELAHGTLKPVRATGWPLQRTIRIVRLREAFVSKAVQQFLQMVRKSLPDVRFS